MNERAERLGGALTVSSAPSAGTEIVLSASGPAIYQTDTKPKLSTTAYE
jgi:nitrate/nitrite-specific signal transduction histidine kinase